MYQSNPLHRNSATLAVQRLKSPETMQFKVNPSFTYMMTLEEITAHQAYETAGCGSHESMRKQVIPFFYSAVKKSRLFLIRFKV